MRSNAENISRSVYPVRSVSQPEAARYAVLAGKLRAAVDAGGESDIIVIGGPLEARYSVAEDTIKKQIARYQDELNEMSPVTTILSDGYAGLTNQSQRTERALDELKKTGYMVEREGFGTIVFERKQINKSMDYLHTPAERAAIAAVPAVLKRGIIISEASEHKTRGFDTVTFGAPVSINGKVGNMGVVVKLLGRNLYKTHRIISPDGSMFVLPEKEDAESGSDGRLFGKPETQIQSTDSASENIIRAEDGKSNSDKNNSRFSIDEKGNADFSETEIKAGMQNVAAMEPVAEITGDEFPKSETGLTDQVDEYFRKIGGNVHDPQLGDVVIDRRGVKSDIAHGIGRKKAASFAAVPAVIEQGSVIDYQHNWKGRHFDTAVVAAPVTIGGEPYFAGVVLERNAEENRFYLHEVLAEKEEDASSFWTGTNQTASVPGDKAPSILNLLHRAQEVKQNMGNGSRFSLNDDYMDGLVQDAEERDKVVQPWEETERQAAAENLPFIGGLMGGGRLPISSALPNLSNVWSASAGLLSGEGNARKNKDTLARELEKPAAYVLPPFGGGQLKKAIQGIKAVVQSGRYGVDSQGRDVLQYPVFSDTLAEAAKNTVQAALFGPTALPTGRAWIQSGFKSMGAAQTEVYKQLISTGEKAREAYSLLNQLSAAASKGDETKKDAQLALLKGSALGNIQRNIVYYGMLASDKEKEVIEGLDNMGAEKADIAGVLGQIYQASKAADKRNALIGANLTDKQKQIIYKMLISDKDPEIVQTCLDDGMSMNEYLKYAADFEGSKEYAKKYTSMKAAGITGTAAAEILTGLADLQPPAGKDEVTFVQKLRVIADSALDDAGRLKAVNAALDKTTVQKMNQANGYGINVNLYTEFQETLPKYDADGNGSYKQAEVEAALDNMELSNTERAVLWQLRTGGKHNPFDSAVGANIRAKAAADKQAGKEAKKDTTSGGFVIGGGIN